MLAHRNNANGATIEPSVAAIFSKQLWHSPDLADSGIAATGAWRSFEMQIWVESRR